MNQNPQTPQEPNQSAGAQPVPIKFKVDESTREVNLPADYVAPWEPASEANALLDTPVEHVQRRGPGSRSRPSPYSTSPLAGSIVEQQARENPNRLHNARYPEVAVIHEKPEHRVIIFLKAQGFSNKEIAEQTGYSPVMVSQIVRQPWAQDRILAIIHEAGVDAVQTLLQGAAADAVSRLISEMDNDLARPSERISAAEKLLDRLYGKPNQPIEHRSLNLSEMSDEELARIATSGRGSGTTTATSS